MVSLETRYKAFGWYSGTHMYCFPLVQLVFLDFLTRLEKYIVNKFNKDLTIVLPDDIPCILNKVKYLFSRNIKSVSCDDLLEEESSSK